MGSHGACHIPGTRGTRAAPEDNSKPRVTAGRLGPGLRPPAETGRQKEQGEVTRVSSSPGSVGRARARRSGRLPGADQPRSPAGVTPTRTPAPGEQPPKTFRSSPCFPETQRAGGRTRSRPRLTESRSVTRGRGTRGTGRSPRGRRRASAYDTAPTLAPQPCPQRLTWHLGPPNCDPRSDARCSAWRDARSQNNAVAPALATG